MLPYLSLLLVLSLLLGGAICRDAVVLNVMDFGAVGDGRTDDTVALRDTLLAAETARGTKVLLPANLTFVSGPLNLTTGARLQVDGTLKALTWTTTDWPIVPPLVNYGRSEDGAPILQYQAFLFARDSHDIKISGSGVIDASGPPWWDAFKSRKPELRAGRPNLLQVVNCHDVEISGVTMKDSPFWTVHPVLCTNVHIHDMKIRAPMYSPNVDGIDPDSCRNVMIESNDISCGDDHIAIKAGRCGGGAPLECKEVQAFTNGTYETVNVTVRNNVFGIGMGIALGSECSGGLRDIVIENNLVGVCQPGSCDDACCGWSPALHLKTADTRGGHMKNILFRNNTIYNTTSIIWLEHDYQSHPDDRYPLNPTKFENLAFQGNAAKGTLKSMSFNCYDEAHCENITFFSNSFDPLMPIECKNVTILDERGKNICSSSRTTVKR
jgi:polygalacturonase